MIYAEPGAQGKACMCRLWDGMEGTTWAMTMCAWIPGASQEGIRGQCLTSVACCDSGRLLVPVKDLHLNNSVFKTIKEK